MTETGTCDDYQNVVEIQDVALAGAFTAEFNEMWGGPTELPSAANSRFGTSARDDTPHRFIIGGRNVECYFEPSDRTISRVISAVNAAQHSVAFGILTLADTNIARALVARKHAGAKVRGVLDNNTDPGTQYPFLIANGVDVHLNAGLAGLLHHKYFIIDAENPSWNPIVITGSHGWISAVECSNNENTVIMKDGNMANQFLQEFAARYYDFGGADTITVAVRRVHATMPMLFSLSQNFPNPCNPVTTITFCIPIETRVSLKLYNVLGEEIRTLIDGVVSPGRHSVAFSVKALPSGVYLYRLIAGEYAETKKMLLLK
jgi:phosphatidylserine/phosphatidylglycerophosphate/cardiolipin synthase-like enzyme